MRHVLSQWFGDGFHKVNQQQNAQFGMQKLPTKDEEGNWIANVKCIQSHFHHGFGFGLPYFYPEVDQYITILRDPFDLMVSMYFFMKGRSRKGNFWFRGRPVDISEKFPNIESYLRTYPYWLFSHLPQDLTLANYQQQLESRFVYIGVYEDLQASMDQLALVLEKPSIVLPLSNASEYDENIPNDMRDQFYHDYPLPKKIYDFAVENYLSPSQTEEPEVQHDSTSEMGLEEQAVVLDADEVVSGDMVMSEEAE